MLNGKHPNAQKLAPKQRQFIDNFMSGMTQTQAARQAGYKFPDVEAHRLMRIPEIAEIIKAEREKYEEKIDMSRQKVMDGLMETITIAKSTGEPMAMVGAWREIARICGYYAPEQKRVEISVNGNVHVSQIQAMTDEELLRVIEGEAVQEPELLEVKDVAVNE